MFDESTTGVPPTQEVLLDIQSSIIKDIVRNGLKSGMDLGQADNPFFTSADKEVNDYIDGVVIASEESIAEQLYGGRMSLFTVLAERKGERRPHCIKIALDPARQSRYEERMQSSFLVITNNPGHLGAREVPSGEIQYFVFPIKIYNAHQDLIGSGVAPDRLKIVDFVNKEIRGVYGQQYAVPDYEKCIKDLLPNGELFIHGVRLPTFQDVISVK